MIHSSAIVSAEAKIGENVEIGPYAVVEGDVEIGSGSKLEAHAIVRSGARIGSNVTVGNFAVVSGLPQDLSFDAKVESYAVIGDGTILREGVTINRATQPGSSTVLGAKCYFMAQSHVGHDCQIGDNVVVANAGMIAGFVTIGRNTFFGGGAGVHQFNRIGEGVMVGGNSSISLDIAPFTMTADRNQLYGLNVVGLRRRKVSRETISILRDCYKTVLQESSNVKELAAQLLEGEHGSITEVKTFLEFFQGGKRGFARASKGKD